MYVILYRYIYVYACDIYMPSTKLKTLAIYNIDDCYLLSCFAGLFLSCFVSRSQKIVCKFQDYRLDFCEDG